MKKLLIIIAVFISGGVLAQAVVTTSLSNCRTKAAEHYPLYGTFELNQAAARIKSDILSTNYLPQLKLEAQASYQSDVTELPISIPMVSIPEPPKDHFDVNLKINQLIYDAGVNSKQKTAEEINLLTANKQLEIDLAQVKDKVNEIYFSVLVLRTNKNLLRLTKNDINGKLNILLSAVKFGTTLSKDADVLKAELIKIDQAIIEIEFKLQAMYDVLSVFTNEAYNDSTEFELPGIQTDLVNEPGQRLENELFSLNREMISIAREISGSRNIPVVVGFGQAGYGKPGLNMLSDKFDDYYLIGAKMTWNMWNWNKTKKEKQLQDIQLQKVDYQQESFNKNLLMELLQIQAEIVKYQKLIKQDEEIIRLRNTVSRVASSQFDNGVITATELVTELNAETQAKLNLEMHRIALVKARVDYATAKGLF